MKSTNVLLSSTLLLSALIAHANAAEYPPQDHGGADLVLQFRDVIWGRHTGIRNFIIPTTSFVLVKDFSGDPTDGTGRLEIYANTIEVSGGIEATGAGYSGGGGGGRWEGGVIIPSFPPIFCGVREGSQARYENPIFDTSILFPGLGFSFHGQAGVPVGNASGGHGDGPGGGSPSFYILNDSMEAIDFVDLGPVLYAVQPGLPDETLGLEAEMGSGRGGYTGTFRSEMFCGFDGWNGGSGGGAISLFARESISILNPGGIDSQGGGDISDSSNGSGGSALLYSPTITYSMTPVSLGGGSDYESNGTFKVFTLPQSFSDLLRVDSRFRRQILGSLNGPFPMATTFFEANHDWEFFSIDGYPSSIPSEDSPTGAVIHRAGGPESLGIWQSPVYSTGKEPSLVRARFTVHSSTPAAEVPTFRMRSIDDDMTETAELWVDSRRDGLYSPTVNGQRYEQYFELNDGDLRFAFDMLHFQEDNANDGEVSLEILEATDVSLPSGFPVRIRKEHVYIFDESSHGWTTVSVPGIEPPIFSNPTKGPGNPVGFLGLQAGSTADVFGFWTSPGDVTLDPDRLYIATFYVTSDNLDATQVPAFRCRLNESGFDTAAVLHISSEGPADRSPTLNNFQQYRVYLKPSGVREDSKLLVSFDLLSFMDDDPETTLSLQGVRIDSIPLSALPQ